MPHQRVPQPTLASPKRSDGCAIGSHPRACQARKLASTQTRQPCKARTGNHHCAQLAVSATTGPVASWIRRWSSEPKTAGPSPARVTFASRAPTAHCDPASPTHNQCLAPPPPAPSSNQFITLLALCVSSLRRAHVILLRANVAARRLGGRRHAQHFKKHLLVPAWAAEECVKTPSLAFGRNFSLDCLFVGLLLGPL